MSLWKVFTDFCFIGTLLLFGQFLRAKVKIIQKAFIPASLIAGILALILGPNVLNIIPFSSNLSTYASILVVVVFAAMPIGDKPEKGSFSGPAVGGMFFNLTGICTAQYAVGMILALYVFSLFSPVPAGFGLMMGTAFLGGPGTAAAVGAAFEKIGWADATAVGMTMVTCGIIGGILFGIVIINWATRKGYTNYVTSPEDLPFEMRTGLVPPELQKSSGKNTISSISLDPMAFHLALILVPSVAGYYLSDWVAPYLGGDIPVFCTALLFAYILQTVLVKTKADKYVNRGTINRINGTATEFLIVSGIGSVKISTIVTYAAPMIITIVAAFILNWVWFIYVGGKSSPKDWLERNMMVWGQANGVIATGILLQRIVDPDLKSRAMEDSGIANLLNRPIVTSLVVVPPILFAAMPKYGPIIITWVCVAATIALFIIAYVLKWWRPFEKLAHGHAKEMLNKHNEEIA